MGNIKNANASVEVLDKIHKMMEAGRYKIIRAGKIEVIAKEDIFNIDANDAKNPGT